jgi:hypothetical protein
MDEWKDKFNSLRRLHDSTNEAAAKLIEENSELKSELILMNKKLANSQKALDINKEIMSNQLTSGNQMKDEMAAEITKLRSKIKELIREE